MLENEKKIRIKSILTLHSSRYGRLELDCSLLENNDSDYFPTDGNLENNLSKFESVLSKNIYEGSFEMSAIIYICGYAVRKLSQKTTCESCLNPLKSVKADDPYFDDLQRGGLIVPSDKLIILCISMVGIFTLLSEHHKEEFMKCSNHQRILIDLTKLAIESDESQQLWFELCEYHHDYNVLLDYLLLTFSNIILNNYRKQIKSKNYAKNNAKGKYKRKVSTYNKV